MKMLLLNICFKLPDDFQGDANDAIERMVEYRRSSKNHETDFTYDPTKEVYDNWWDMVTTTDRILHGQLQLAELKGQKWVDIEVPTENQKCKPK